MYPVHVYTCIIHVVIYSIYTHMYKDLRALFILCNSSRCSVGVSILLALKAYLDRYKNK